MVHDVAEFLRAHPPFDTLDDDELARVAAAAQIEFHARGAVLLAQGVAPADHVWVVRTGAVELLDGGAGLDLLGEGEMIGHPSMLSGLPASFEARAAEDTLTYRLPADVMEPVLARPAGIRFVARTLLDRSASAAGLVPDPAAAADPAFRPVGSLIQRLPVTVRPDTEIRSAARRMGQAGATAVVVDGGDGDLGIVTDRDLRSRVATGEVPVDAPVSAVMTARAFTVSPEQLGGEVLVELLDRGIRHAPVVDAAGSVLGVLDDLDLLTTESRRPFRLRRAIADATTVADLTRVAEQLHPATVALFDSGLAPPRIAVVDATIRDALTRRLVELAEEALDPPPVPYSWLALGSLGRREALPSSDADTALVWHGDDRDPALRAWMAELGSRVVTGLEACGQPADEHGVRGDRPLFARSADAWREALASWIDDPGQEKAVLAVSILFDGRVVAGEGRGGTTGDLLGERADRRPATVRLLARLALAHRPPTGFRKDVIVEHSGEHRGTFDIKRAGVLPIVDLARWAGIAAGAGSTWTPDRLYAGADAGLLAREQARTLAEAWDLLVGLRLEHQVGQLREGLAPDDHVDPARLNPLTRRYLREAFRSVAAVQRRVAGVVASERTFGTGG